MYKTFPQCLIWSSATARTHFTEEEADEGGEKKWLVPCHMCGQEVIGLGVESRLSDFSRSQTVHASPPPMKHDLGGGLDWPQATFVLSISVLRKMFRYSSLSPLEPVGETSLSSAVWFCQTSVGRSWLYHPQDLLHTDFLLSPWAMLQVPYFLKGDRL